MARNRQLRYRLDTLLEVQAPPPADDPTIQSAEGEVDLDEDNWTAVGTVWAELVPESGGLVVIGDQDVAAQSWRVTVRRGTALDVGYRLKALDGQHAGKFFAIDSFGRAERDEEEVLLCKLARRPAA